MNEDDQKNPGGRPLKFQSVEKMKVIIDEYFDETPEEEWTVTGLCLALGTYRDVLMRYEKKDEFYNTIKTAKTKIEHAYEKSLRKDGRSSNIFALKNFGWRDTQDLNHGGQKENPLGVTIEIVRNENTV